MLRSDEKSRDCGGKRPQNLKAMKGPNYERTASLSNGKFPEMYTELLALAVEEQPRAVTLITKGPSNLNLEL